MCEPLFTYLKIASEQSKDHSKAGFYNVGPDDCDCITTGELVTLFCEKWKNVSGNEVKWVNQYDGGPHEANFLKLDCSKMKSTFDWKPRWNVEQTMEKLVEWYYLYNENGDTESLLRKQVIDFIE